ncbi:MAG TPA: tRNA (5-methylaminomethyl-2-thiouridine)(34)-methyltransferase MnmD [Saprospiraceae bacterium]|nr:tRNA (5-methylaminomethyl-2-thiouridine)(34)-methyltransferase MnmD [Saprospiraceae bacterium]
MITILRSEDGTDTLMSDRFGVSYHSMHGALHESITVFLSAGLHFAIQRLQQPLKVFEMGLGSGLNALLTYAESVHFQCRIFYTAIELFPLSGDLISSLNFNEIPELHKHNDVLITIHKVSPGSYHSLLPDFHFRVFHDDILKWETSDLFHVIYYDAFAPNTQSELWTEELMLKMYRMLEPGGVLVSYCAKGSFKRALRAAGFEVEPLPGPNKKREMTRAIKLHNI